MKSWKPLNKKSYGSIPHLPNSRLGIGDHKCSEGQARIATERKRDKHDTIIVQEKLDGSNVGIAKLNDELIPLTRAGYVANTSPFKMHHEFYNWVLKQKTRFFELLYNNERLCGEWLLVAHGTKYDLPHEPFVGFDLMTGNARLPFHEFINRIRNYDIIQPNLLNVGDPLSVKNALEKVNTSGHGAIDPVEGCVWRVERDALTDKHSGKRKKVVDYLVKYVKPEKIDGIYLSDNNPIYNTFIK